jgi:hypothetical protein
VAARSADDTCPRKRAIRFLCGVERADGTRRAHRLDAGEVGLVEARVAPTARLSAALLRAGARRARQAGSLAPGADDMLVRVHGTLHAGALVRPVVPWLALTAAHRPAPVGRDGVCRALRATRAAKLSRVRVRRAPCTRASVRAEVPCDAQTGCQHAASVWRFCVAWARGALRGARRLLELPRGALRALAAVGPRVPDVAAAVEQRRVPARRDRVRRTLCAHRAALLGRVGVRHADRARAPVAAVVPRVALAARSSSSRGTSSTPRRRRAP